MDGVSHVPRSNAGDSAHAALQADPAAGPTSASEIVPPLAAMPLMQRPVLDAMLPSMVSSSLPPHVAEVDALMRMAPQVDPLALLNAFTDNFLAIDKSTFGAEPDPLGQIIDIVAAHAQPPFYAACATDQFTRLAEVVGRIRNWMVSFLRRKEYYRTGSALTVLVRLPLREDIIRQVKLQAVIRKLEKEQGAIGSTARLLTDRFPEVFADSASQSQPQQASSAAGSKKAAAPPKLFGNIGVLKLGSHKRQREASPEVSTKPENQADDQRQEQTPESEAEAEAGSRGGSPREERGESDASASKRAKKRKVVRWKADEQLVSVRFFEMEGEARFKSAKNARQQEHDEGSAMHQGIDWCTPKFIDFTNAFRADFQSKMSSKRGGTMEPDSEEARVQERREARVPMAMYGAGQVPDSPKEPAPQDAAPEPGRQPRQAKEPLTGAPVPAEWRHKYEKSTPITPPLSGMATPFMNPMAAMAQMNPMMAGYQFGAGYPMGMNPAQMSEMMAKMGQANMTGMYGFQGMNQR